MNPVLLVIAGPNGSGKTTVTVRLRADRWSEDVEYLNPDDVARDRFGDWNSPEATLEAARWTTARREALLAAHQGIAFETVFSTDDKLDFVARARTAGYFVRVFFIGTSDPRINAARVAGRVMAGGHTVSIEKIISRYGRSMANLAGGSILPTACIFTTTRSIVSNRGCARARQMASFERCMAHCPSGSPTPRDLPHHPQFVDLRGD
jgi:predicted ABC-type ATPase